MWGCPVYVLEPALQDGKKIPRWKPRSRRAVFLWLSPQYASTVPLVLNPATSHISPQFHVIFDDLFSTVVSTLESSEEPPIQWEDLCIKHRYQVEFEENDPVALNDEWLTPEELLHQRNQVAQDRIVPPPTLIEPTSPLPALNIPTSLEQREQVIKQREQPEKATTIQTILPPITSPRKSPMKVTRIQPSMPRPERTKRRPNKFDAYDAKFGSISAVECFYSTLPDLLNDQDG